VGVAVGFVFFADRGASELVVHVDGSWRRVRVRSESQNLPSPLSFLPMDKEIRIDRIGYGPYDIAVEFEDDKVLWLECFHSDAGKAKSLDVTVERVGNANTVRVTVLCTYRWHSPSRDMVSVNIDQTNAAAPARVWGGP
jgi:hypothetical protein